MRLNISQTDKQLRTIKLKTKTNRQRDLMLCLLSLGQRYKSLVISLVYNIVKGHVPLQGKKKSFKLSGN